MERTGQRNQQGVPLERLGVFSERDVQELLFGTEDSSFSIKRL